MSDTILIGYPTNFGLRTSFEYKLARILPKLEDFQVISIDDTRGFIEGLFGSQIVERINSNQLDRRSKRKIVTQSSHVILFWDGFSLTDFVYFATLLNKPRRIIPVVVTQVVNKDKGDEFDVYIGRKSPWGNPYAIGPDGKRDEVIAKFKQYFEEELLNDPSKKKAILALKGKRLGCHCKPLPCHGDIIAEYLNTLELFETNPHTEHTKSEI